MLDWLIYNEIATQDKVRPIYNIFRLQQIEGGRDKKEGRKKWKD